MTTDVINYKESWYPTMKPNYLDFDEHCPEYWEMTYSDRWREMINFLPADKMVNFKLLDIGCGLGRAMKHFRDYGVDVLGVEVSDYAVGVCKDRGLKVIHSDFIEADIPGLFDVIYIEQVLSHMPDYQLALYKAWKKLEEGGLLIIEEPNDYNPLQMRLKSTLGEYWKTEDHCNYFNYDSLTEALEEAKFKVVKKSCTWPMELYELSGRHYVGDEKAGQALHREKTRMLKGMDFITRDRVLTAFADIGIGRDVVLFAKKEG